MGFTLEHVVPWGRSFDEYIAMFDLSDADLLRRILGCGDGPASFNALLTRQGGGVLSVDPLYRLSTQDIRKRIIRMDAMEEFLSDYSQGVEQGRYVEGELPHLPFNDREFDLAVCSHLLFLYSEQLSEDFHVASIQELCRIAREVRVFPLLELGAKISRHLQAVTDELINKGYDVSIVPVRYEFQKGGNKMMKVWGAENRL